MEARDASRVEPTGWPSEMADLGAESSAAQTTRATMVVVRHGLWPRLESEMRKKGSSPTQLPGIPRHRACVGYAPELARVNGWKDVAKREMGRRDVDGPSGTDGIAVSESSAIASVLPKDADAGGQPPPCLSKLPG